MSEPAKKKPAKKKFCAQSECNRPAVQKGFCRLHYLANWKHIRFDQKVKAERRLNAYVDRMSRKYPADFMEKIKEGLESEDKFKETIEELDLESDQKTETEREYLEKFSRTIKGED